MCDTVMAAAGWVVWQPSRAQSRGLARGASIPSAVPLSFQPCPFSAERTVDTALARRERERPHSPENPPALYSPPSARNTLFNI